MAFAPIPEYEGKSPYVFITYAQQDEKVAYSIAVKMFNEGFRIWSSAACGNPSNMRIAERLSNSAVAMVFLSKSYLKYASYNEFEPRIVMTSPKPKIVVCLDDTPLGTDWNTVDFPAGIRYNPEFPQELWLRINSSDALEVCRGAWPSRKMPMPFEDSATINISVDSIKEEDVSGELSSLNSVMSSFGAGLDDEDITNISLFRKKKDETAGKSQAWKEKNEPSQEQEYYAIENLIDTTPMPAEQKQYNSMIGLIENFMEKSNRVKENELKARISVQGEASPHLDVPTENFVPLPLNEFDRMDMSGDIMETPVIFTDSSLPYSPENTRENNGFVPMDFDYSMPPDTSDDLGQEGYTMTRRSNRSDRFGNYPAYPTAEPIVTGTVDNSPIVVNEPITTTASTNDSSPVFETIVDDRKLITSTEDNFDNAKLTYHLGVLDNFDESNYVQEEKTPEPQPEIKFDPVDHTPVRFTDNEKIGKPALSFQRPPEPIISIPEQRRISVKYRKRWRVAVRTRINHIEYENEMYKVNGRWIPGEIYHAKMPNARYTEVRSMPDRTTDEPEPIAPVFTRRELPRLNTDSRLAGAVDTFRNPRNTAEIPADVRAALRQRHEVRQAAAIRQLEIEQAIAESAGKYSSTAAAAKPATAATGEEENVPARKHKYSHEAGIKKSLMLPMESPVDIDMEESSHRQYGARAEVTALYAVQETDAKKGKKKKGDNSAYDRDEDALIALPTYGGQPKVNYDPAAYSDMNLSEILFSNALSGDGGKHSKKKKKK